MWEIIPFFEYGGQQLSNLELRKLLCQKVFEGFGEKFESKLSMQQKKKCIASKGSNFVSSSVFWG